METTLNPNLTKHRMFTQGLDLFYKKGYYNTSVEDICEKLSISKTDFLATFGSKQEFFIEIVQRLILQRTLDLLIVPESFQQSPFPLILDMIGLELEKISQKDGDYGFILSNFISELNQRNPGINKHLMDILNIWRINLVTLLKKGKKDGYVNTEVDCEAVANHVISSFIGIRTLMVGSDSKLLANQYLQQLRYYFRAISQDAMAYC